MRLVFILILMAVSGLYAALEMSLFAVNEYELDGLVKKNNKKAIKLKKILEDKTKVLVTINLIIVLCNMLASAFASEQVARHIVSSINVSFISVSVLTTIVVTLITILLSSVTLIFSVIIPKQIGLANFKKLAYNCVGLMENSMIILEPLIWLFDRISSFVLKLFHIENKKTIPTATGLKEEVIAASSNGRINNFEKNTILKTFNFNNKKIEDIMKNIEDVECIDYYASYQDIVNLVNKNKYTRFPVKKDGNIVGILNFKELFGKKTFPKKSISKCIYISKDASLEEGFKLLKKGNNMALVKNRKIYGIVTIEDIIEEIIGNVKDEYRR